MTDCRYYNIIEQSVTLAVFMWSHAVFSIGNHEAIIILYQ